MQRSGRLGIAQWLAGTILGDAGERDSSRVLGAPAPED